MEHAEVKFLLVREMPHTGHKRLLERPVIGPFGKGVIDVGPNLAKGDFLAK
jgi:hypothetical protein